MNRPWQRFSADSLSPNAPTPCFCPSCMRAGGAARERLRATWMRTVQRLVDLVPDHEPQTKEERRERQRGYDANRPDRDHRRMAVR